jgi:poly-beta-hydroxyalkanoate depolymerase
LADLAIKALAPAQSAGTVAFTRNLTAAHELIARAGLSHDRPPFGIDSVIVGDEEVAVHEKAARVTPFGALLHFKKAIDTAQPRVLLVAPLS